MTGNPDSNKTLFTFTRVPPAPYDRAADEAALAQMLASQASFQPEPDRSKDVPTALFSNRQRWNPTKTIGKYRASMIDDFPHRLGEAAAHAVNNGNGTASVWREGWRDNLSRAPLPFPQLSVVAQEKIKARGDDVTDRECEEPRYSRMVPALTVVDGEINVDTNGETNAREDYNRVTCVRFPPAPKPVDTPEFVNTDAGFKIPSSKPERRTPIMGPNVYPDTLLNNDIRKNSAGHMPKPSGTPYPKLAMRFPHHRDQFPPGLARGTAPSYFHELPGRSGSMEVNVPLPAHMPAQGVRELVDRKVDSLRSDMDSRFEQERELTEKRIAAIKQDDSKVMELEIRLKMSEEEKGEYEKEIWRLRARVKELEGKE